MEKILENGTEVLIFNYISEWGLKQDMEHYIRGTIIKSEMSEDLSYHGSPWNVINYTVLGEDEIEYFGNYRKHTLGSNFFMTEEDYIYYLNSQIEFNNEEILELKEKNNELIEMIKKVKTKSKQKVLKKSNNY